MSSYDIYIFILCLIVFVSLTALFSCLITAIIRLTVRLIRAGLEDTKITEEYMQMQQQKRRHWILLDRVISIALCCVLFAAFLFSVYVNLSGTPASSTIPTLSVVKSSSMSYKHEKNTYLQEKGLHDQFGVFDIVLLYKLPPAEELELYDIVLYEMNDTPIVHRIVGIEPPNETHSDYYFLLQGDAVESPDRFPVYYSQMRGIYRGQHIPFVGSFVAFLQSVAGYLCILLTIFGIVTIPIVEKKINAVKIQRLKEIGVIAPDDTEDVADTAESERSEETL